MIRRTRTGCITCRRRRTKCDERKPTCDRCRAANFLCEGYDAPRRTSSSLHEVALSSRRHIQSPDSLSPELPWRQANWRQEQLPLYHHFVTSTVVGLFRADHVRFWRDQVAQMSFGVDCVYEALIAVAAAHRASLLSCSRSNVHEVTKCKVLGMGAYGRALRLLAINMNQKTTTDPWAVLIVLLLCTYFESFMGNSKAALQHLWAAIQVFQGSEARLSATNLANMVPVYEVVLRLDFLAQKLLPFAGSSFTRCSDLALMNPPFWNRQPDEYSNVTRSNSISSERHRLIQLVCGHNKLSRVVWGCWYPTSERPSRDEEMGFYNEMMLWKATSPATFETCPDLERNNTSSMARFKNLPMPPRPLQLTSSQAAVNIIMFNGYLGCALAMISTTDENPIDREIEIYNLVYQNLCIAASLLAYKDSGQVPDEGSYKPCDALDMGISVFLYNATRRCFSSDWQQSTMVLLRKIGHEGLSDAHALANTIEIMCEMEKTSLYIAEGNSETPTNSALGPILGRLIPLLMPHGSDKQFLAYFLRTGAGETANGERIVRIVGRATWSQDESGVMHSLEVDTNDSTNSRTMALPDEFSDVVSSWRQSVEHGWHGFLS